LLSHIGSISLQECGYNLIAVLGWFAFVAVFSLVVLFFCVYLGHVFGSSAPQPGD